MQHAALMLFGTISADYRDGGWPPENRNKCFAAEVSTKFFLIVMHSSPFDKPISIADWSAIVLHQINCLSAQLIMHPFVELLHDHPLQYHYRGTLQIHCARMGLPPCDLHKIVGLSKHVRPFTPHFLAPCPCVFCKGVGTFVAVVCTMGGGGRAITYPLH